MSDGTTKAAIYNEPVLYKDNNGEWQDIDNSLQISGTTTDDDSDFDGYTTPENQFKVKFAKNSNQKKLVQVDMDNYSVSLSLQNKSKKNNSSMKHEKKAKTEDLTDASSSKQKVYYENILPNTDIEYIVNGSGVKENIVVKSKQDSYVYDFEMQSDDLNSRRINLMKRLLELQKDIEEIDRKISTIKKNQLSRDAIYTILLHFDKLFEKLDVEEKKKCLHEMIDSIEIRNDLGAGKQGKLNYSNIITSVKFNFPINISDNKLTDIYLTNENDVETVCLLTRKAK